MNRPPRNPRRAYDEHGNEIAPPTVGHHLEEGLKTLAASCDACHHDAVVDVTALPADLPCPDVALKLRCSECGSKRISVRLNMAEYYEMLERKTGWKAAGS